MASSSSSSFSSLAVKTVVVLIVVLSLWASVRAAFENVYLSSSIDEVLTLIAKTRDYAHEANAVVSANDDLLGMLLRTRRFNPTAAVGTTYPNRWGMPYTVLAASPVSAVLETVVPTAQCKKLALFFIKDVQGLGVQKIEAREDGFPKWRALYDASIQDVHAVNPAAIAFDCGSSERAAVRLTYGLK